MSARELLLLRFVFGCSVCLWWETSDEVHFTIVHTAFRHTKWPLALQNLQGCEREKKRETERVEEHTKRGIDEIVAREEMEMRLWDSLSLRQEKKMNKELFKLFDMATWTLPMRNARTAGPAVANWMMNPLKGIECGPHFNIRALQWWETQTER